LRLASRSYLLSATGELSAPKSPYSFVRIFTGYCTIFGKIEIDAHSQHIHRDNGQADDCGQKKRRKRKNTIEKLMGMN